MVMGRDTNPDMSAPVGARAGCIHRESITEISPDEALAAVDHL